MNEYLYAKSLTEKTPLTSQDIGNKPSATLNLLARYYRDIGKTNDEIKQLLDKFLCDCLKNNYESSKWVSTIDYQVLKSKKYGLKKVDKVEITANEMNVVNQLKNKSHRKILFTMLVISKFYNEVSENNNNWVNLEYKQIFGLANVAMTIKNQALLVNELYKQNLISISRKVGKPNIQVNFVDSKSDSTKIVLTINRLWNLGKEYLLYCGENYIRCEKCGDIIKNYRNSNKYCKRCAKYQPIVTKTLICCDCGKAFEVDARNVKKIRCDNCQNNQKNVKTKERVNKYRKIKNNNVTLGFLN